VTPRLFPGAPLLEPQAALRKGGQVESSHLRSKSLQSQDSCSHHTWPRVENWWEGTAVSCQGLGWLFMRHGRLGQCCHLGPAPHRIPASSPCSMLWTWKPPKTSECID
jgi:hypothetical protein